MLSEAASQIPTLNLALPYGHMGSMKNSVQGGPKHEKPWQIVTGFIQAAEEKCTENGNTKKVHAFRTCLWIETHPNRFLREPLAAMLTLAFLSLKGYAHFWHLTSDTLTAMGLMEEERICFAVKKRFFFFLKQFSDFSGHLKSCQRNT